MSGEAAAVEHLDTGPGGQPSLLSSSHSEPLPEWTTGITARQFVRAAFRQIERPAALARRRASVLCGMQFAGHAPEQQPVPLITASSAAIRLDAGCWLPSGWRDPLLLIGSSRGRDSALARKRHGVIERGRCLLLLLPRVMAHDCLAQLGRRVKLGLLVSRKVVGLGARIADADGQTSRSALQRWPLQVTVFRKAAPPMPLRH